MPGNTFKNNSQSCDNHRMRRIAFVHHKGGTGKTTACLNIAGWLSKMNYKVLVVDLDPQANATSGLGIDLKSIAFSMSDVLFHELPITEIILETNSGVYLAPAAVNLLSAELALAKVANPIRILENKLLVITDFFDFILVDLPPGSTLLMMNGIVATRNIIIPLDTGVFGFETLETLKRLLIDLEDEYHISINIIMALLKDFSSFLFSHGPTNIIYKMTSQYFLENGLKSSLITTIPFSKKIFQAQMKGMPISHYAPNSQVGRVYRQIAKKYVDLL